MPTITATTEPTVDSFRYVDFATRKTMQAWMKRESPDPIPWTPMSKPLAESRLCIVSSAALALHDDRPFDSDGERRNPWWGDPSYREIPAATRTGDVHVGHLHIDARTVEKDLDCVLPLERAAELAAAGVVGDLAPTHFTFMGYLLKPEVFLRTSVPAMIERMHGEDVDVVLLVPV
jgi:D-proline reductase (dithiol) PrdB